MRFKVLGRTSKKNPRMGEDFVKWADEESIIKIILNTYDYVKEYINPSAPGGKEYIGYIVDRTGFEEFKRWALKDVQLPEKGDVISLSTGRVSNTKEEPLCWMDTRENPEHPQSSKKFVPSVATLSSCSPAILRCPVKTAALLPITIP